MKKHVPVTIVSGFLGSGKTTLINRILHEAHGIRFALIINEFGEIGLDDGLIKGTQDFIQMDNGCLCCVLSEELVALIAKLKERDDFDAVVLETTGIADPLPIAWPFLRPEFEDKFRFAGIVTVADGLHLFEMLDQGMETRLQLERADYIYVSKTDVCEDKTLLQVQDMLLKINENARHVLSRDDSWLDLMFDYSKNGSRDFSVLSPEKTHRHESHSFLSVSVSLENSTVLLDDIEDFFETLPQEVFRAKAIFQNKEDHKIFAIHSVCGRVDFYEVEKQKGQLAAVFIGKGFDPDKLKKEFLKSVISLLK